MPLPDMLSTIRHLILDLPELPKTQAARLEWYRRRFMNLTPAECEDLSRIEPSQLETYTTSIFISQGKLMVRYLPRTMAVLSGAWEARYGVRFRASRLMQRVHQMYPWRSSSSFELATNLASWIRDLFSDLLMENPRLASQMRKELTILEVRKSRDLTPRTEYPVEALAALRVSELLELQFAIPGSLRALHLSPPSLEHEAPGEEWAICARDPRGVVHWRNVSRELAEFFLRRPTARVSTIADLAEAIVPPTHHTSAEALTKFIGVVADLIRWGAIDIQGGHTSRLSEGAAS